MEILNTSSLISAGKAISAERGDEEKVLEPHREGGDLAQTQNLGSTRCATTARPE